MAVCGLLLMLCTPFGTAIPLSSFYPYGSAAGDAVLPPSDDGSSSAVSLPTPYLYYGTSYTSIFVNNNGDLTFNAPYSGYTPQPFPISGNPMIAPFFADVDTRGAGKVWYRVTYDSTLLSKAVNDTRPGQNFAPLWLFITTWDHVGYYNSHTDKTNTFQCILTTDNNQTYAIFQYADGLIQWTTGDASGGVGGLGGTPAQVGFNAGDSRNYANVQDSRTPAIINITRTSNVLVPGQWIFSVHNARISADPPTILSSQPTVYGIRCYNHYVQLNCTFGGSPLPTITWTSPNGRVLISHSRYLVQSTNTSTSLTISPLSPGDSGTYTCTASNFIGVSSASIQLIVQTPPTIQSPQPTVYGVQGQSVQLICTFDGLPVPNITWISPNGSVIISQSHFMVQSTNTSTSLTISPLGPGDSGTYTCEASNFIGVSSASIQLTIDISQLLCQYNYTIGTTLPVIITQSDPVCLICSNKSSSMWTINQIIMQTIAPAPYILYVPSPATTFLGGPTVACYSGGTSISSTVYIVAPMVSQPVVTTLNESKSLNLNCSQVIIVSPSLPVKLNQLWLNANQTTVSTSSSYSIPSVSRTDTGNYYTCVTMLTSNGNVIGSVNGSIKVVVNYLPIITSDARPIVYGIQGHGVQLNCTFDGFPFPTVTWTSPNGSVLMSQSRFIVQSTNISTSLTISPLGPGDSGTYNCTASNLIGVSSASIQLIVKVPPTIQSSQSTVYRIQGQHVQLNCTFGGLPVPNITWTTPNGSVLISQSHFMVQSTNTFTSLTISPLGPGDSGTFMCTAFNNYGVSSASIQLIVQSPPSIQSPQSTVYVVQGQSVQLNCTFYGLPVPTINWTTPNGNVLTSQSHFMVQSTNTSTSLTISPLGPGDSGTYMCTASNFIGMSSTSIQLIVQNATSSIISSATSSIEALVIGVPVSIVAMAVLILIIIIISVAACRKTQQRASRKRIRKSKDANAAIEMSTTHIYSLGTTDGHVKTKIYIGEYCTKHFEDILVNFDQLQMDEQPCGSGEFGVVYHATLTTKDGPTQEVAVKSTKNTCSEDIIKAFLEECASMKSFDHPNVLGLVGMCLNSPNGVPLMVLPFMANGNLKKYLQQARRYEMIDQYPEGFPCNILISMCLDIAKGMSYLADKRIVHRDLAARNCLVDIDLVIKVGDFGLSRDIYMENYYRPTKNNKCPVKWMPPEMIRDGISTERSDVWAYGVTCWEVFSIGTTPYPGVENFEMLDHLEKGLRLQQPNLCPDTTFKLMKCCWVYDPQARPTFVQLVSKLELLSGLVKSVAEEL